MVWIDVLILLLVAVSAAIGVWRGFVKEALSVLTWVLAVWISLGFSFLLDNPLAAYIAHPGLRAGVAIGLLFAVVLIVGAIASHLAVKVISAAGLRGIDRSLGALFGFLRGAVIVVFLVILAGFTSFPQAGWWHDSLFLGLFQQIAIWVKGLLPADLAGLVRYG